MDWMLGKMKNRKATRDARKEASNPDAMRGFLEVLKLSDWVKL